MNGYYRPTYGCLMQEVRPLDLSEIEYVSDDEETPARETRSRSKSHAHRCPRCGDVSMIVSADPYCSECNWDSLTDPAWRQS